MEKLKQAGSGNVPALMFTVPESTGKAYTQEAADLQRRKALMFLAGITAGKSYPEIKADCKRVGC